MTEYSLVITAPALEDLNDIRSYIADRLNNPSAASEFSDKIFHYAESLILFPKRNRVRKKIEKGRKILGIRYMPVDNFIIIYCVDDSKHTVNILRVMYGRRNLTSIMI